MIHLAWQERLCQARVKRSVDALGPGGQRGFQDAVLLFWELLCFSSDS